MRHRGCITQRLALAVFLPTALVAGAFAAAVNPPLPVGRIILAERVSVTVELARAPEEKGRGLSGRPVLKPGEGMLFVYDQPQRVGIWMKDMRFPLDIVWIREGRIVQIEQQAPPLGQGGPETVYTATADLVLEVRAGFTARQGIRVGDSARMAVAQ
jgi:uncharacterized membrane protein (UPF0127 family)